MVVRRAANRQLSNSQALVPFLKWAGGKRWLVNSHPELFPRNFQTYHEPFLGSGAVFFWLNPKSAILSDANPALIETYSAIRADWRRVARILRSHQNQHSESHYYKIRETQPDCIYKRAGRFIYLNRTCWNGLYRVNRKGQFNVPIGTKSNVLLQSDDFETVAARLKHAELKVADFEVRIDAAREGDFIFLDPPYTVAHNLNGFVKYNEELFSWGDQVRLQRAVTRARVRGVRFFSLTQTTTQYATYTRHLTARVY